LNFAFKQATQWIDLIQRADHFGDRIVCFKASGASQVERRRVELGTAGDKWILRLVGICIQAVFVLAHAGGDSKTSTI
jgi:hypothetical protein